MEPGQVDAYCCMTLSIVSATSYVNRAARTATVSATHAEAVAVARPTERPIEHRETDDRLQSPCDSCSARRGPVAVPIRSQESARYRVDFAAAVTQIGSASNYCMLPGGQ